MQGYSIGLVLNRNEIEDIERRNNLEDFSDIFENDDHEYEYCCVYVHDMLIWQSFTEEKPHSLTGEFIAIRALKAPDPFKAAYSDPDEIKNEMEISFGRYLPGDFDWNAHLGYFMYIMRD